MDRVIDFSQGINVIMVWLELRVMGEMCGMLDTMQIISGDDNSQKLVTIDKTTLADLRESILKLENTWFLS